MAKKKTKTHRRRKISIAIAAGFVPLVTTSLARLKTGGIEAVGNYLVAATTGYDRGSGKWSIGNLSLGLVPIIAGVMVHKFVGGWLGLNRAIGHMKLPINI